MFETVQIITASLLIAAAGLYFCRRRDFRYLQYFQQEDYEGKRFLTWCKQKSVFDTRGSLIAIIAVTSIVGCTIFNDFLGVLASCLLSVVLIYRARAEENPLITGKVRLKLTERARRIFDTAQSINALLQLTSTVLSLVVLGKIALAACWFSQLLIFQLQPLVLVLAKVLLGPQEKALQADFAEEARAIVKNVHPTVVGITGSYGKTSTKVILNEILDSVAPTFSTPRSINSYMGVTREIRERMKSAQKFAVIEMGAYYLGSIRRMCGLTPPTVGIVTAVGEMHLERFGNQENLFKAKSELAQAVPNDGILVVNGDYDLCRKMAEDNPKRITFIYGLDKAKGPLDGYMYDLVTSDKGTSFKIDFHGRVYEGFSKLLSKPLLANALAAFTAAMALGCAPEVALAAIRNAKTESNRLEPVRTALSAMAGAAANGNGKEAVKPGEILRLNDAFNSNPVGFSAALDVLGELPGGRKVLVTPGMIELGERQVQENEKMAKKAATMCDLVVVVGRTNRDALISGLQQGGMAQERYQVHETMQGALQYLGRSYCSDGDIVLIENDLADLYESTPRF
jgi:UDP-N-acetylmuramoyl-tripeptide--D-alanyl-D-alanine ligase